MKISENSGATRESHHRIGRYLAALVLAASIAVTGLGVVPAGAATSKGLVHLTVYAINTDGPKFRAVVSGAIRDYGPAVSNQGHTELTLDLSRGTFQLDVATLDEKLTTETADEPLYSATCSDYFHVSGTVAIVAHSGTGAYRGITGSFSSSIIVNEDQGSPCSSSQSQFQQILFLDAVGRISK